MIFPMNAERELTDRVGGLRQVIREKSGLSLNVSDDFIKNGETAPNGKEILIGYTNRDETAEVMNSIGYFDYAIRTVNNKIVIAAHTKEALFAAMDLFCSELLTTGQKDGTEVLLLKEARTATFGTDRAFFTDSNQIERYQIVYPNGSTPLMECSNAFAEVLHKRYGIKLKVVNDLAETSEFEILIGVTNRDNFQAYYTGAYSPDPYCAMIRAVGNTLLLTGNDDRSSAIACKRFISKYADHTAYTPRLNFADTVSDQFVAFVEDPHSALTEGTDLRVMSYNVLSKELSPDKADFAERQDLVFSTILNYRPDVVGLQEVSATAWNLFEQNLGNIYSFAGQKTPAGAWSYTGLMWNPKTVRMIETESLTFELGNQQIRLFVWGVFEHIETGERFIAGSTHWDVQLQNRPYHAAEMTDMVRTLIQKYQVPVITTGDFNSGEGASYFTDYLIQTGQTDTMHSALESVPAATVNRVIDHVTCTADIEPLFFKYVQNEITADASDHHPVFTDFRFK